MDDNFEIAWTRVKIQHDTFVYSFASTTWNNDSTNPDIVPTIMTNLDIS
jgi:hypothetical protein